MGRWAARVIPMTGYSHACDVWAAGITMHGGLNPTGLKRRLTTKYIKHMISIVVIIIIIIIMFIICIMITDSSSSCAKVELMFV